MFERYKPSIGVLRILWVYSGWVYSSSWGVWFQHVSLSRSSKIAPFSDETIFFEKIDFWLKIGTQIIFYQLVESRGKPKRHTPPRITFLVIKLDFWPNFTISTKKIVYMTDTLPKRLLIVGSFDNNEQWTTKGCHNSSKYVVYYLQIWYTDVVWHNFQRK